MTTREWDHRRHGRDRVDARKEFATECACRCGSRCAIEIFPRPSSGGCPRKKSHFEGRADLADGDDDGLEAESQDRRSGCRRCREHGYIERGVDQEGHEAEESPSNKGALRARGEDRSKCKVCSRLSARSSAPSVQGVRWGMQSASTVVCALIARSAVGHQSASTVVSAIDARSAVGRQSASTVVERTQCKECGGASICEHGRVRSSARSAAGHQSASTVVCALSARSAVGHKSASTVVSAISARSAVVQESASTVVGAIDARSVLD